MSNFNIRINKLGPVTDANIKLNKFVLFSGESGIGKSYVAMLCHYVYVLMQSATRLNSFFSQHGHVFQPIVDAYEKRQILSVKKSDLEDWIAKDGIEYLKFLLGTDSLEADISVSLPETIPSEIIYYYKRSDIVIGNDVSANHTVFMDGVQLSFSDNHLSESPFSILMRSVLNKVVIGEGRKITNTFILPPSRGSIMTENFIPVSGMYQKFYEGVKFLERVDETPEQPSLELQKQLASIMEGETKWNKDHYDYAMASGGMIPLSAAASSVKELSPIEHIIKKKNIAQTSVLIEEPEAHLHPLKQQMMADVLVAMAANGANLIVTTHSDYIIRRMNEVIQLQSVREKLGVDGQDQYRKLSEDCNISPDLEVDINSITSYYLKRRLDGSTEVCEQSLENGIPYTSFGLALERGLTHSLHIENYLDDDDD